MTEEQIENILIEYKSKLIIGTKQNNRILMLNESIPLNEMKNP